MFCFLIKIFYLGVHWIGKNLIPGSRDVTKRLQKLGKTVYFITNAPNRSRKELQKIAQGHGYNITEDSILSASYAAAAYLHRRKFTKKVYVIGQAGTAQELEDLGIEYIDTDANPTNQNVLDIISNGIELDEDVGAVIVSFDEKLSYLKILEATNYLKDGNCLFIGTSLDEIYPTKNGIVIPATAPNVRAIEVSSGRKATIVGKPNSIICESLLLEKKIIPGRTLIIGDSAKFDILLGTNCGFQTLLVGTGVNNIDEVREWQTSDSEEEKGFVPDVYLPKLGDLMKFLE